MYFSKLVVENVKCFGNKQCLDLKGTDGKISRWTLILGDNGVGKTSLLKCLSWMTPVQAPNKEDEKLLIAKKLKENRVDSHTISEVTGINISDIEKMLTDDLQADHPILIKPFMDDFDDESQYEQLIRLGNEVKTNIEASFVYDTELETIPKEENTVNVGIYFEKRNNKLEVVKPTLGKLRSFATPSLYAYSASRHMGFENLDKSELSDPIFNLFSESADLYDAEQILSNLNSAAELEKSSQENIESSSDVTADSNKLFELVFKLKKILTDLLPHVQDVDNIIINPRVNRDGTETKRLVEIKTPFGKVPLIDLSLGYKTMLAWVVDLAIRMLWRNPNSNKPLEEPAVVIVDEIDLHLHPKWQRLVKQYLVKNFPNTQFICTAHSPFMAQASTDENLCVLNQVNNEVLIENSPYLVKDWRIGQIVTSDLFGISNERRIDTDRMIEERRLLTEKESLLDEEKDRLRELDKEYLKLPILDKDNQILLDQIRESAELLRQQGKI